MSFWKEIMSEKDRKHVSEGKKQKSSNMAEIRWNKDMKKLDAKGKLQEAKVSWKEHVNENKKNKEDETLDLQDNKFNAVDEKGMKK